MLQNIGTSSVILHKAGAPTVTYEIGGLSSYALPAGLSLNAGEKLYIANIPAAQLRTELNLVRLRRRSPL